MYERFTDRARTVMQLANQERVRLNQASIGSEHLLLALIKEGRGVAANALKNLGIDLDAARREVASTIDVDPKGPKGQFLHTPRARMVVEFAMEEARNLNHNYVGTEHLLLALLRVPECVAAQVLMELGLNLDELRREVLGVLGHGSD